MLISKNSKIKIKLKIKIKNSKNLIIIKKKIINSIMKIK